MFQNNMTGHHFTITHDVIVDLELCSPSMPSAHTSIKHWHDQLGVWVKVHEGSVIDFSHSKIGCHLFLKAGHVTQYAGFQELLNAIASKVVPHLRNNLRGAHDSVRIAKLHKATQAAFGNNLLMPSQAPHTPPSVLPTSTQHSATRYAPRALVDPIVLINDTLTIVT